MTSATSSAAARSGTAATLRGRRILIAKPGLDGHDIGAKIIALALRNAGAEVIYTGLRKSPEQIARVAIDEGVDAVGLSILSGSHRELAQQVIERLREAGAADIKVFVGGTIPLDDREPLQRIGVQGVFDSDMPLQEVVAALARTLG
ncbi:MAG: cobalamin B12-binding domain-containing protein [Burkholderiaceae bacterium]|nr:cobalamin B12-binding domain-containing protein [Burkholderiaceae bacterium]